MNDREIEKRIESVIEKNTPDRLDEILKACNIGQEELQRHHDPVIPFGQSAKKRNRMYNIAGSLAAALLICIAGIIFVNGSNAKVAAIVGLDVNPSIEMSVNKDGEVLEAVSINKDGEKILDGMELKGADMDVAANAILGSMLKNGYLNDVSNSVLVSVQSDNEELGSRMEKELSKSINEYIESCAIGGAILGQYVGTDEDTKAFAEKNQISTGKAALIRALVSKDSRLSEDALLKITTHELLLLAEDKKLVSEGGSTYGNVNSSDYISKERALDIVMERAGISESDIDNYSIEFECDEGQITYEVDITCGLTEYEAELDACLGTILEFEKEGEAIERMESDGEITYNEAKKIAIKKAGVPADQVTDYEAEIDDGQYEIEFDYNNIEYEVEIDYDTGDIIHFRKEYDDN